jgi:hypothetical protein
MSTFIPGDAVVDSTSALTQSALPNAPVVVDEPRRGFGTRLRVSAALRAVARLELRLAERIDPAPRCTPTPDPSVG